MRNPTRFILGISGSGKQIYVESCGSDMRFIAGISGSSKQIYVEIGGGGVRFNFDKPIVQNENT